MSADSSLAAGPTSNHLHHHHLRRKGQHPSHRPHHPPVPPYLLRNRPGHLRIPRRLPPRMANPSVARQVWSFARSGQSRPKRRLRRAPPEAFLVNPQGRSRRLPRHAHPQAVLRPTMSSHRLASPSRMVLRPSLARQRPPRLVRRHRVWRNPRYRRVAWDGNGRLDRSISGMSSS